MPDDLPEPKRSLYLRLLEQAKAESRPVTFDREADSSDRVVGFVEQIGDTWLVLRQITSLSPDGFCALPIGEIKNLRVRDSNCVFSRATALWPSESRLDMPPLDTASLDQLIRTAANHWRVATIYMEYEYPNDYFVGSIEHIDSDSVTVRVLDSDGIWMNDLRSWVLEDITFLEFGDRYATALFAVAVNR